MAENKKEVHSIHNQITMNRDYLSKENCKTKATTMIESGVVRRMSVLGLAQEIFAHACCYYGSSAMKKLNCNVDLIDELYLRANPVDIDDGGDTPKRVAIYKLIWSFTPSVVDF